MSIIKDIFFMEAEAKIAESINNEIQLENFELQAKEKNIMELKPTPCKSKLLGLFEYTVCQWSFSILRVFYSSV